MTETEIDQAERYAVMEVEAPANRELIMALCREVRRAHGEAKLLKKAIAEDGCIVSVVGGPTAEIEERAEMITELVESMFLAVPRALANPPAQKPSLPPHPGCVFRICPTPEKCEKRCESAM